MNTVKVRRARNDDGAALIEFAIILPVMLIIFFGLTQLGFAMKTSSTVTGATRSGARVVSATYPAAARSGDPTTIANTLDSVRLAVERDLDGLPAQATPLTLVVFEADANGNPTGGASCASSCISWTWNGTKFASKTGSWSDPMSCGVNVDKVGVRVIAHHDITSPFMNDLTVTRTTTMRLEPVSEAAC